MSDSEQNVRRTIPLRHDCMAGQIGKLLTLDGVLQASCKGMRLKLTYDVRQINLSAIESALKRAGMPPRSSLLWHIKRAFYRYVDDNIRAASGMGEASCCSHPQDIYASRRHEK